MHILEIPSFFPPYGGLFCLDQSKALASFGNEVRIIANIQTSVRRSLKDYIFKPFGDEKLLMDGIEVMRHEMRGIPLCVRINIKRWIENVLRMYEKYVRQYGKPDILHAHCAKWAGYAACLISRKEGMPFVITEHLSSHVFKDEFGEPPSTAWQIPLLKEAYRCADMVIPVSDELVDNITPYFGCDYRHTTISNTIDTDFFSYRRRKPLDGRKYHFCCLANYIPLKGYDVLFNAFDALAQLNSDVELWIAGCGTDTDKCRQAVREMESGDKVRILGLLDKNGVRDVLYQSDCLVLPSRSEAQPLVLLEAMSTGIETISTECVPQCLRIEGGCHIVPVDDTVALRNMMIKVIEDGFSGGEELSLKVREKVSPAVIGRKIDTLLRNVIENKKKGMTL